MAKDKMKSEDAVPQADTQAHTEMAEREGQQGEQAHVINKAKGREEKGAIRTGWQPFVACESPRAPRPPGGGSPTAGAPGERVADAQTDAITIRLRWR
jgi:hypothetical protein